jgi:predicted ATPase
MSNQENLSFEVYSRPWSVPGSGNTKAFLVIDNWDDFGYQTLFRLGVFDGSGSLHNIGYVKIGKFGMGKSQANLPASFYRLDDEYFSLGQDDSYYEALSKLDAWIRDAVLSGLRDVVFDVDLWRRARGESVTTTSLLRSVTPKSVEGQFRRLIQGGARLTAYDFTYTAPEGFTEGPDRLRLSFTVKPESTPPTNIHVLIGRNGVGKTHILQRMAHALVGGSAGNHAGGFTTSSVSTQEGAALFANLVSVSWSAFDDFELIPERRESIEGIRSSYIGLKKMDRTPKSPEMLVSEFVESAQLCRSGSLVGRWRAALGTLEADPVFREAEVTVLTASNEADEGFDAIASNLFRKLSSGHKSVLLTMTRLVETVQEQTLVLLDEPECHLHPPLLSAFVRSLSDLMIDRNGVAIIATHSPVVLQEVPKTCVWMLYRTGQNVRAERPEVETFGENVGVMTREVFGYEVTESGFHKMLQEAVGKGLNFDQVLALFNNELGAEARAILRGLSVVRRSIEGR